MARPFVVVASIAMSAVTGIGAGTGTDMGTVIWAAWRSLYSVDDTSALGVPGPTSAGALIETARLL